MLTRKRLAAVAAVAALCAVVLGAAAPARSAPSPGPVGVEAGIKVGGQVSNAQGTTPDPLHQGIYVTTNDAGDGNAASATYDPGPATGCDDTGCGTWDGRANASVDEQAGTLKAFASNALSIDDAQTGFGGTSDTASHATVHDTITLSQAATVHVVGTLDGTIATTNDTGGEYDDPSPGASVAIGFFEPNTFCRECGPQVVGYTNDFGVGPASDTFDIPVDLPAGESDFVADLELDAGNILLDGPSTHESESGAADFSGTVNFEIVVPDDVVATSTSGNLPISGGAPPQTQDTTPPVTTATAPSGWSNSPVTVSLDATDDASGVAGITYSASGANPIAETTVSGSHVDIPVSADGTTTITYHATDVAGNVEDAKTVTVEVDATPPVVTVGDVDVDATGPDGAVVTYTATATDGVDPSPSITCTPASGTRFSIGVTNVTCTARDEAGNESTGSFTVTVHGALDMVGELPNTNVATAVVLGAARQLIRTHHTRAAIAALDAYIHLVQSPLGRRNLTQAQIEAAVAKTRQIVAVLS